MDAPATLHPTDQTLHAYGLGKLDDASADGVYRHLEGCPACRQRVADMSADSFVQRIRHSPGRRTEGGTGAYSPGFGDQKQPEDRPPTGTLPPELIMHQDYEIVRELGRGGMGVVYLARNKLMGRLEVLKVVSKELIDRPGVLDRFLREIQSAARLHHPNIVTAYSAIRIGDGVVFAMEYVEGDDLSRLVKGSGPLPVLNACFYASQAAVGLQHALDRGMVHRDIKPGNLIVTRSGKKHAVKILDFGLAKATSENVADAGLTGDGRMLGTPDYVAPEQMLDARKADIRADVYSLGCTLYYLLSGRPPFSGSSVFEVLQAHHSVDARMLNLVRPEVPAEVASVVARMMAKEPGKRYQTPLEVAQALAPYLKAKSFSTPAMISQYGPDAPVRRPTVPGRGAEPTRGRIDADAVTQPATPVPHPSGLQQEWEVELDAEDSSRDLVHSDGRRLWIWGAGGILVVLCAFLIVSTWRAKEGGTLVVGASEPNTRIDGGTLVIRVNEPNAQIVVDGGRIAASWDAARQRAAIALVPGDHVVEVSKEGFVTFGRSIRVAQGVQEELSMPLEPIPDYEPTNNGFGVPRFTGGTETVQRKQIRVGEPQFTLTWDAAVDLDLHVFEPGGSDIGPGGGVTGEDVTFYGDHEGDVQAFGPENVFFRKRGPAGEYKWHVVYVGQDNGEAPPTRWKCRVKHNGSYRIYEGTLQPGESSRTSTLTFEGTAVAADPVDLEERSSRANSPDVFQ